MKISQMSTDKAADVLVRITQPVSNIMDDSEVETVVRSFSEQNGNSLMKAIASIMPKIVPLALKNHREDLFEIVGALGGMDVSEVKELPLMETMAIIRESMDKD